MKYLDMTYLKKITLLTVGLALLTPLTGHAETTLRMGLASLPTGNGNPFTSSARTSWYTYGAMFDTLTQLGPNLSIAPGIAVAWENTDDLTWIVNLRDGVTFSNGEPLDAEAALFSYRYLQSEEGQRESLSRDVADIASMEAIDAHTIKFVTKVTMPEFSRLMAVVPLVAPQHWQALGRDGFAFEPVGTGPFQVTKWQATRVELNAVETAWRAPQIDKLELLALPETASRVAALLTDRVDVASEIGPDDTYTVEGAGLSTYKRPATSVDVVAFNILVESPLQDVRVRRALNYAVNKEAIAATIMDGRSKVMSQMTADLNPERNPDLAPYPYDPDKAKALLAEAGHPNGFEFIFEFSAGTGGTHMESMYQQVAADLVRIGVEMEVRPLPWAQYVRGVLQGEWNGQAFGFEYEVLPTGSSMRPFRLHSCSWPYPWYCDRRIEPAIARAKSEMNVENRMTAVREVLAHYHREAAALMLVESMGLDGVNPQVQGYTQDGGRIPYHAITLDN